jgi:hypothetical protein
MLIQKTDVDCEMVVAAGANGTIRDACLTAKE